MFTQTNTALSAFGLRKLRYSTYASARRHRSRALGLTAALLLALTCYPGGMLTAQHAGNKDFVDMKAVPRLRYSDGLLTLRGGLGMNYLEGDFNSTYGMNQISLGLMYSVLPKLNLGIGVDFGRLMYTRSQPSGEKELYNYQFGTSSGDRQTKVSSFYLDANYSFWQLTNIAMYGSLGAGLVLYEAQDYAGNGANIAPKADFPGAVTVPLGAGMDYFIMKNLALNADFRYHFVFSDNLDAYDQYNLNIEYGRDNGKKTLASEGSLDHFATFTLGFKYVFFENNDYDNDLLLNGEEEALGTDPYNADTDGDGLSDFEEVRRYSSNPHLVDTDADGIPDYDEVMKLRTNPSSPDSDGDGLPDFDEVYAYSTIPIEKDSDEDGLTDAEELEIGTDPMGVDTDFDGLSDFAEVRKYHSDPLNSDTDQDGVFDYNEVMTYHTDIRNPDTDGDGLTDYEEIAYHQTNPLSKDTDGDNLFDDREIVELRTSPLDRDTDGDGIPDDKDKCPLDPETYNGVDDTDGCPDGSQPGSGFFAGKGPGYKDDDGNSAPVALGNNTDDGEGNGVGTGQGRTPRKSDKATIAGLGAGDNADWGEGNGVSTGRGRSPRKSDEATIAGLGAGMNRDQGEGNGVSTGRGRTPRGIDQATITGAGSQSGDWGEGNGVEAGYGRTPKRILEEVLASNGGGTGISGGNGGRGSLGSGDGTSPAAGFGNGAHRVQYGLTVGTAPENDGTLERYNNYTQRSVRHIAPEGQPRVEWIDRPLALASSITVPSGADGTPLPDFSMDNLEEGRLLLLSNIHFEFDKDAVRAQYQADLMEKSRIFKAYPEMVVEIRGHTDAEGGDAYNRNLSLRRALAVKNFFVRSGVEPRRLKARGFGEDLPISDNDSEGGRALNRRVELLIEKMGPRIDGGSGLFSDKSGSSLFE